MKSVEKIFIAVLATLIFFVSGGIACTYSTGLNLILVSLLAILIFLAAGYGACRYGQNKIEKRTASRRA